MLITDFLSQHPANDIEDPREVVPINFKLSDKLAQVVMQSQAWKQWELEQKVETKSEPQPDPTKTNSDIIQLQDDNLVPTN